MPEKDGYDLLRCIRSRGLGETRKTPVIALTGFAQKEDLSRVLAAGFNSHLAKPMQTPLLINEVQRLAVSGNPGWK